MEWISERSARPGRVAAGITVLYADAGPDFAVRISWRIDAREWPGYPEGKCMVRSGARYLVSGLPGSECLRL